MREHRAQIILLVRAFEEVDRDGRVLAQHARALAGRRALMVTGLADGDDEIPLGAGLPQGEAIFRRARLLFGSLVRRLPALPSILRISRHGSGIPATVVILSLIAGLSTNLLGPRRVINLLSFPLLGLLAWNVTIYVGTLLRLLGRRWFAGPRAGVAASAGGVAAGLGERLAGPLLKFSLWYGQRSWSRTAVPAGDAEMRLTSKAMLRFGALWHRAAAPLLAARARRMLHLAAMTLVGGAIVGMYLRGIAFEYQASWESTLLGAAQVQALLDTVLWPAAWVLDVSVPDVAPLQRPASGAAATWLHLYAVTAMLFVLLPRLTMIGIEGWRCRRLSASLGVDLDDGYYRRIFSEWLGSARSVMVLPYSFRPKPGAVDRLKGLLHEYFGARAEIRMRDPLSYGAEPPSPFSTANGVDLERGGRHRECLVVLFNLAQSPESEVHGALLERLKTLAVERDGQLLVLVDESVYRRRVHAEDRWSERLNAWRLVIRDAQLRPVALDLDGPVEDTVLNDLRAAVWPPVDGTESG